MFEKIKYEIYNFTFSVAKLFQIEIDTSCEKAYNYLSNDGPFFEFTSTVNVQTASHKLNISSNKIEAHHSL